MGQPINVTNGNMWLRQTDYVLPGIGEPIQIERFYNSRLQESGLFGHGWTTDYDESLYIYSDRMLRLDLPDAKGVFFARPTSTVPFKAASAEVSAQIVKNTDNTYTLTFQDGRVRRFDTAGRLEWQRDRSGNQTTLGYNAGGQLISVTDAVGRVLTISPNANGTIAQVSDSTVQWPITNTSRPPRT